MYLLTGETEAKYKKRRKEERKVKVISAIVLVAWITAIVLANIYCWTH